jgi:hypothetical protein
VTVIQLDVARREHVAEPARESVEAASQALLDAHGCGWAGRLAGLAARDSRRPEQERQLWCAVEAEIARRVGFAWYWPEDSEAAR